MSKWIRFGALIACVAGAALSMAASTITVTSPAKGTLAAPTPIKGTTSINFNIVAALGNPGPTQVTVSYKIFRTDTGALYRSKPDAAKVTPNTDGKVSGSFSISFSQGVDPELTYRVEVRAIEEGRPGEVYNTDQDLFLRPDLTAPKILQFNPLSGAFVKGVVRISAQIRETNLKDWRVQVDGADLPNGDGTTVDAEGRFSVEWDTSGVQFDGGKSITIRVRDTADNEVTQTINVTIDRVKPVITIRAPLNNASFPPNTTLIVTADVRDIGIAVTGVDVVLRTMGGAFITRVARQSFSSIGNNTFRWTGRVRWRSGLLPSEFKVHVTAIDRAGNAAVPQSVTVRVGG